MVSRNWNVNSKAEFKFSLIKYPSTQFTCWVVYWTIFICLLFIALLQNACPFRFLGFIYIFPKSPFFIPTNQNSSQFGQKYLCGPLNNRGSVYFKVEFYHIFILSNNFFESIIQISSFQHFAKQIYSFHYFQQNRPSLQRWQTE